ncbi:MAG: GNAT family N-acetyltransferase [Dehalococcoidia bacterium]|uniref:GNAT family N-acetyltransferase n=1 Tax=Candidatus Amarobacter glycogenicus TaxID=3140699 RepID=UPI00313659CA|nr:GNAT family N-acetyltransferase [Dehalococcoidia bacterium]
MPQPLQGELIRLRAREETDVDYEKVGFQYEGTIRDGIFKAGRWNDLVCMGLLRGELR